MDNLVPWPEGHKQWLAGCEISPLETFLKTDCHSSGRVAAGGRKAMRMRA